MAEKVWARAAVMLVLLREGEKGKEILLQRRQNTGYEDGMWDCAATGHVDEGEGMRAAVIREAAEEIGITVAEEELRFLTIVYKYTVETGNTYFNAYFLAGSYRGKPRIMEPDKCAELKWFPLDSLPEDLIFDREGAILNGMAGVSYGEIGWEGYKT